LYYLGKDISNERIYSIITGSDKPDCLYEDETNLEEIQNGFVKLVEEYKNKKRPI
jgi:hypothetical protein